MLLLSGRGTDAQNAVGEEFGAARLAAETAQFDDITPPRHWRIRCQGPRRSTDRRNWVCSRPEVP
jgi:hypothetical protein